MKKSVLVINCGSSSIKFQVLDPKANTVFAKGLAENIGSSDCVIHHQDGKLPLPNSTYEQILHSIIELIDPFTQDLVAIGHRVVHGGEFFSASALIDEEVTKKIKECNDLAPLHNPVNLMGIEIIQKKFKDLPNVAVFDTAFHSHMPQKAYLYAVNYNYYKELKIRKYGFHGTSHRYISMQAKKSFPEINNLIIAHLGNGASLSAVKDGACQDTSMGLTPLEGLVMGSRSGDIDVSIVQYLCHKFSLKVDEVTNILNKESGLLGLSQISSDMRILEEKANNNDMQAILAIEVFCYRLAKYIYSYHVPLQNVDALIFTGGIGENSSFIREKVISMLPDYDIDKEKNMLLEKGKQGVISKNRSKLIVVIPTNEELLIAKDALEIGEKL